MRDANGGYGRAGLKEEILERPRRKRKNARTTDLPDNPNATGVRTVKLDSNINLIILL
jgi:hypothetical protein